MKDMVKNVRHWLHLSLVAFVWLFIMPVCICESLLCVYLVHIDDDYSQAVWFYIYTYVIMCIHNYGSTYIFDKVNTIECVTYYWKSDP